MRRWIAGMILGSMLFGQTELHELFRVPAFIQHFLEHRSEKPSTTLVGFIVMHYFSGTVRDEDYAKDQQLPFRSHDDHAALAAANDLFSTPEAVVRFFYPSLAVHALDRPDGLVSGTRAPVWQPPKRA